MTQIKIPNLDWLGGGKFKRKLPLKGTRPVHSLFNLNILLGYIFLCGTIGLLSHLFLFGFIGEQKELVGHNNSDSELQSINDEPLANISYRNDSNNNMALYNISNQEPIERGRLIAERHVHVLLHPLLSFYHKLTPTNLTPIAQVQWSPLVPTAFGISAHNEETIYGAVEIIRLLYHPNHMFIVHIDSKVSQTIVDAFIDTYSNIRNVKILDNRINVQWAKFSIVEMELKLIKAALAIPNWFAYVNVCGSSVPLKSIRQMDIQFYNVLQRQKKQMVNFHSGIPMCRSDALHTSFLCPRTPARCLTQSCNRMTRTPDNQAIYKGSQWFVITREYARYVIYGRQAKRWATFFKTTHSHIPDEMYFQTLLANHRRLSFFVYNSTTNILVYPKIMYSMWRGEGCLSNVQPRVGSPCYLGNQDWTNPVFQEAIRNPDILFARKIHATEPIRHKIELVIRENA